MKFVLIIKTTINISPKTIKGNYYHNDRVIKIIERDYLHETCTFTNETDFLKMEKISPNEGPNEVKNDDPKIDETWPEILRGWPRAIWIILAQSVFNRVADLGSMLTFTK